MAVLRSLFGVVLAITALHATAQTPARIRGDIVEFAAPHLVVKSLEGEIVKIKITERTTIAAVKHASLADIVPGKFVGAAARPQPNGKFTALEVHIFPESLRGAGEGNTPFDGGNTMTNATVESFVTDVSNRILKLHYRGGEKQIAVPEGIPIVSLVPADTSVFKAGARIYAPVQVHADGSIIAARVFAATDGANPPM